MNTKKEQNWLDWLCGKTNKFPFGFNPINKYPIGFEEEKDTMLVVEKDEEGNEVKGEF